MSLSYSDKRQNSFSGSLIGPESADISVIESSIAPDPVIEDVILENRADYTSSSAPEEIRPPDKPQLIIHPSNFNKNIPKGVNIISKPRLRGVNSAPDSKPKKKKHKSKKSKASLSDLKKSKSLAKEDEKLKIRRRQRQREKYKKQQELENKIKQKVRKNRLRQVRIPTTTDTAELKGSIPEGHEFISTALGDFIIRDYSNLSEEDLSISRRLWKEKYKFLNEAWKDKGYQFDMPGETEPLKSIEIRYQQTVKYLGAQRGGTIYKYILIACWVGTELLCKKLGLEAEGYTVSQCKLYDIYHNYTIELGQISPFGEGWPPWVMIVILSLVNLIITIILKKFFGGLDGTSIMQTISPFITGKSLTPGINGVIPGDSQQSVPSPPQNPLSTITSLFGGGNEMDMISGIMGALGNFMGGDEDEETPVERQPQTRSERRRNRIRPPHE